MNDYQASDELVAAVKGFEGLVLVPTPDIAGHLTGGYGHKYAPGEYVPPALTGDQADNLIVADLHVAGNGVRRLVTVEMTQSQFDGLTDFAFNLGIEALANSTMLLEFNAGNTGGAAQSCLAWDHAHVAGRLEVLKGLQARRVWDADHIAPSAESVVWKPENEIKDAGPLVFPPIDVPVLTEEVPDPNLQNATETPPAPAVP